MSMYCAQESTESAAMLSTASREGAQGTPIYTYDYKVPPGQTCQHKRAVNSRKQAHHVLKYIVKPTQKLLLPCRPAEAPVESTSMPSTISVSRYRDLLSLAVTATLAVQVLLAILAGLITCNMPCSVIQK